MSQFSIGRCAVFTLASLAASVCGHARAEDFTAGTVMQKMSAQERYPYLAGVVEGLAFSRYMQDGKKTDGMKCIYDWFYDKPDNLNLIYAAMGKYPSFTPGAIIGALVKKDCGA
jgi:hypothetical protein